MSDLFFVGGAIGIRCMYLIPSSRSGSLFINNPHKKVGASSSQREISYFRVVQPLSICSGTGAGPGSPLVSITPTTALK